MQQNHTKFRTLTAAAKKLWCGSSSHARVLFILAIVSIGWSCHASLQFTDIGANLVQVDGASVAWGDYDNDGQLDLLITGSRSAIIYHNSNGVFTASANLQGISYGGAVWGDYNNDGRLDVMLNGFDSNNVLQWRIYRNDGLNTFTQVYGASFGNYGSVTRRACSLGWGDYDNDGKLDALFIGWPYATLFHNNGNDSFTDSRINVPVPAESDLAWGDYNNDGNLDFVVNGGGGTGSTALYENLGNGVIVPATNNLTGVYVGCAAWEDINNDGNLDLAITGINNNLGYPTIIYVGDGHGGFTNLPSPGVDGTVVGSIAWGDFDNDGLPDLVVSSGASSGVTKIYHNNGDGTFTDSGVSLPGCSDGGIAVGDFNNDGKLDIAIVGSGVAKIFRNDSTIPVNTPPTAPQNLTAVPSTNGMVLSWPAATDANQSGGLSYNLRVGTTPGGIDVAGPMADPASGFRRIPAIGNAGLTLSRTVTHLQPGTYYWSVQAIDHAFAGSAFAGEQSFNISGPSITTQPVSETNALGTATGFQVTASGTLPIAYQWYFNGTPLADGGSISGSGTANLTNSNVQVPDAGSYTVVLENAAGSVTSLVATLTVSAPPVILGQPTNTTVIADATAIFTSTAAGTGPFTYQWQFAGTNVTGATNANLTLMNVQPYQAGPYTVAVSNAYGGVISSNAMLAVIPAIVTIQPASQTSNEGTTVSFNAIVTGPGPFTYQWQFGTNSLLNATNSVLTLPYLLASQTGSYDVVVSNSFGVVTGSNVQLTVTPWPYIQPPGQTNLAGTTVSFTANYGGNSPLGYQWYFNGTALSDNGQFTGSATASLTISNIQISNIGGYQVSITNTVNVETSTVAILGVTNYSPFHYVAIGSVNPVFPYSDWSTAATNIQDAIDASVNGDQIFVTNGIYHYGGRIVYGSSSNRVVINKAVTVASVNGPAATFIQGYQQSNAITGDSAVRCVYMTNGATLTGFTLTNGATRRVGNLNLEDSGGGVWCESSGSIISNCIITADSAYFQGGGAYQGTYLSCVFSGNLVSSNNSCYGGAAFQSTLVRCTVIGNSVNSLFYGYGGGVYNCGISNCLISSNSCTGNIAYGGGTYGGTVANSALVDNNCDRASIASSGYGGGAYNGNLVNCTVVNNYASYLGGGTYSVNELNCINYFNVCPNPAGYPNTTNAYDGSAFYCCSIPQLGGIGCFTNDPLLAGTYHLSTNSPCHGTGAAFSFNGLHVNGTDIDGEPWASPPSVGCDEIYPGNVIGNMNVSIATALTNFAPGFPGYFQANISGPVSASVWNFGDGTSVTNEAFVSHTWMTNGNYVVTLTGYNDSYPTGQTAVLSVQVSIPTIYYVDLNCPNPLPPYSYWNTAANNIQDAVDAAVPGSLVLVTNGNTPNYNDTFPFPYTNGVAVYQFGGRLIYGVSNRVAIYKPITVESMNGPKWTWIYGAGINGGVRGVYLTNGATLIGFTVTNAAARSGDPLKGQSGGGIWCESTNNVITNCVVTRCIAIYFGSGVYSGRLFNCLVYSNGFPGGLMAQYGGGAYSSILNNCTLIANAAQSGGGAASCMLNNCVISNNFGSGTYLSGLTNCLLVQNSGTDGGGAQGGAFTNCTLIGNFATAYGGGAYGSGSTPIVLNNCLIASNTSQEFGGGVDGGPSYNANYCVLNNCTLAFNTATNYGGGAALATLNNCTVSSNTVTELGYSSGFGGVGGGIESGTANGCMVIGNRAAGGAGVDGSAKTGTFSNCVITGNITHGGPGGGASYATLYNCSMNGNVATNGSGGAANFCTLSNCTLSGNIASCDQASGQGGGGAANSTLLNCLIESNSAPGVYYYLSRPSGEGGGTFNCSLVNCLLAYNLAQTNGGGDALSTLVNCTVVSNSAPTGGGVFNSMAENSIIFDNVGTNYYYNSSAHPYWLSYCCTTPSVNGPGNITNDPAFVNPTGGDFHLQSTSPCINSGDNSFVTVATDLDGNPRIVGRTVDIGAYEYQNPSSILSYAWAQQYGLPTDGSADYLDLAGTGMPNWQKAIAGLNPTNPASILAMNPLPITNVSTNGVTISWQSVDTRVYALLRATDLTAQPAFSLIQSNLVGQSGTTAYTDITATNSGPYFYRVGIQ